MSISSSSGKKTFKIIFLGDTSTGKTSIIQRFVNNKFQQKENATIGIDFLGKNITHNNSTCRLQLWDTAGQQRFRSLIPSYLKDAICAIFVFDQTKQETLENLQMWINMFLENKNDKAVTVICGNKSDLSKQYNDLILKRICQKHKMQYFDTSASRGEGIQQMFHTIVDSIIKLQQAKRKKFQQIDIMAPLTHDSFKQSTGQTVNIRVQKKQPQTETDIGNKKKCCC